MARYPHRRQTGLCLCHKCVVCGFLSDYQCVFVGVVSVSQSKVCFHCCRSATGQCLVCGAAVSSTGRSFGTKVLSCLHLLQFGLVVLPIFFHSVVVCHCFTSHHCCCRSRSGSLYDEPLPKDRGLTPSSSFAAGEGKLDVCCPEASFHARFHCCNRQVIADGLASALHRRQPALSQGSLSFFCSHALTFVVPQRGFGGPSSAGDRLAATQGQNGTRVVACAITCLAMLGRCCGLRVSSLCRCGH